MKLESLKIELRQPYSAPGPNNPYVAKLTVGFDENHMTVALNAETCRRILQLAGDEIAAAAQVQVSAFVAQALTVSAHETLELEASGKLTGKTA